MNEKLLINKHTDIPFVAKEWKTIQAHKTEILGNPFYYNIPIKDCCVIDTIIGKRDILLGDFVKLQEEYFSSFLDLEETENHKIFIYQLRELSPNQGVLVGYSIIGTYLFPVNYKKVLSDISNRVGMPMEIGFHTYLFTPSCASFYDFLEAVKLNQSLEDYMIDRFCQLKLIQREKMLVPTKFDGICDIKKTQDVDWQKLKRERQHIKLITKPMFDEMED